MASDTEYVFTRDFTDNSRCVPLPISPCPALHISRFSPSQLISLVSNIVWIYYIPCGLKVRSILHTSEIPNRETRPLSSRRWHGHRVTTRYLLGLGLGGYIQWGEPDSSSVRFEVTKPKSKPEKLKELWSLLKVQDPRLKPMWLKSLPEIFPDCGSVDVEADAIDAPPHLAFMLHECGLVVYDLIAQKTKNEKLALEAHRLLPLAVNET
ncbi:UMTA methyltransferase family protein [Jackrogersella minutella]|nr:UMTA methyltransferase family protein [Jackrogersella minutella]